MSQGNSKLIITTSWDDGCILDLKLANLLVKYGVKGTFYLPRSYLDNSVGTADILSLAGEFEIGAHTLSHTDLTAIPLEQAEKEIRGSKLYLEQLLGRNIHMFCYPKGRYNDSIKGQVCGAGFVAARTVNHGDFNQPRDPYEWQITLHASNGSPLMTWRIWRKSGIPIRSLLDWEIRAKLLFDLALERGGIYHIWGHSWEIEKNREWTKLESVLGYIANRENIRYMTNGEIFSQS
jgi:hypothetical protein